MAGDICTVHGRGVCVWLATDTNYNAVGREASSQTPLFPSLSEWVKIESLHDLGSRMFGEKKRWGDSIWQPTFSLPLFGCLPLFSYLLALSSLESGWPKPMFWTDWKTLAKAEAYATRDALPSPQLALQCTSLQPLLTEGNPPGSLAARKSGHAALHTSKQTIQKT